MSRNDKHGVFLSKLPAEATHEVFNSAAARRIVPGDNEDVHSMSPVLANDTQVINLILPRQRPERQRQRLRCAKRPAEPTPAKNPRWGYDVQITPAVVYDETGGLEQRLPLVQGTNIFAHLSLLSAVK